MKRAFALVLMIILIMPGFALAQDITSGGDPDDKQVYKLMNTNSEYLTSRANRMYVGDEYISGDNKLYRISSVDDQTFTAYADLIGDEPGLTVGEAREVAALLSAQADAASTAEPTASAEPGKKLICMYSTHSDESYIKGDGTESKIQDAGIYDIGDTLKEHLESHGIEVKYSKETSLPHDAGAYRRSRQIAEDFIKERPTALLDIHRDGIPDESSYTTEVDGEKMTQVRLFVGRNNPNSDANRSLAKKLKADADNQYPGFIKDIFVGKGNYNQELYPQALLLEFGTHTSDKDDVKKSTEYMADVINNTLFGGAAQAEGTKAGEAGTKSQNASGTSGIMWVVGIAILLALIYGLAQTGTLGNWKEKLARGTSEVTGGMIGKKKDKDEP